VSAFVQPDRRELDRERLTTQERSDRGRRPGAKRLLADVARRERLAASASEDELVAAAAGACDVLQQDKPERTGERDAAFALLRLGRDLALDVVPSAADKDLVPGEVDIVDLEAAELAAAQARVEAA
jgi:hypothetical protein